MNATPSGATLNCEPAPVTLTVETLVASGARTASCASSRAPLCTLTTLTPPALAKPPEPHRIPSVALPTTPRAPFCNVTVATETGPLPAPRFGARIQSPVPAPKPVVTSELVPSASRLVRPLKLRPRTRSEAARTPPLLTLNVALPPSSGSPGGGIESPPEVIRIPAYASVPPFTVIAALEPMFVATKLAVALFVWRMLPPPLTVIVATELLPEDVSNSPFTVTAPPLTRSRPNEEVPPAMTLAPPA